MDKSKFFRNYNAAKKLAREGKLDGTRLKAAFSIAQRNAPIPYNATPYGCQCGDAWHRNVTCKHQIAAALREA